AVPSAHIIADREQLAEIPVQKFRNRHRGVVVFLGGVSVGGPVVLPKLNNGKNRTFMFGAFEKYTMSNYQLSQNQLPGSAGASSRYEVRDQLKRILLSRHLVKARKKSHFLEFMCEQALAGKAESVNECTIGTETYE